MSDRFQELLSGLDSPLETERVKCIERLIRSNDIRAIRALQQVVSRDASVRVRYMAKKALYLFKERMKGALPGGAGEDKAGVAAQKIDPKKIQAILSGDDVQKKLKLLQAVAKFRLKGALPILMSHGKAETDPVVRSNLVLALGILGDQTQLPEVKIYLEDADYRVRANAIEAIEAIDHPEGYPALVHLLADPDNRIRANAIKALKHYGKINVANLLRKMIHSDQVWMRDSAAYALSVMAKDDALPLLLEATRDEDEAVRDKARKGILKLAEKGNRVAQRVLAELERVGDRESSPGLLSFTQLEEEMLVQESKADDPLDDPDPQLRLQAVRNIVAERDSARAEAMVRRLSVEDDHFVKANIINALGTIGDEKLVDPLRGYLSDPVDRVRANAVEALARLGGDKVSSLFVPLLADSNNRCRANAIVALKDYAYVDVINPLREMVESDELLMRKSAFFAITDIAGSEVVPLLELLRNDEDGELRANAMHFLQMMRDGGDEAATALMSRIESGRPGSMAITTSELFPEAFVAPTSGEELHGEGAPSKADQYDIKSFSGLDKERKRSIIRELGEDVNVGSYYFLRQVLADDDFEIKVLAKMALKNFDDFAGQEDERTVEASQGEGVVLRPPEIETVEYHGMSKAIQLSRELNDRADQYEFTKMWKGPFPAELGLLNALRDDTREMIQELLGDDGVESATVCFHQARIKPFLEGKRSLDGNRFANVITLVGVVNRMDAYSPCHAFLKSIKRPIYLLTLLTKQRVLLFLRGPLETSFARFVQIHYGQIDEVTTQKFRDLVTLSLKVGAQFFEIPELYGYVATPMVEAIREAARKARSS